VKDNSPLPTLLIVEDSDEYFEVLTRIIARVSTIVLEIYRCIDGDDALDFLNREGLYRGREGRPNPDLMILDLNLPGTDGREVLATIEHTKHLRTIPVVILTTSSNPKDIAACYESGANTYIVKPMDIKELTESVRTIVDYWFKVAVLPTAIKQSRRYANDPRRSVSGSFPDRNPLQSRV
jgi:DNA-binding response OmpR family regulator